MTKASVRRQRLLDLIATRSGGVVSDFCEKHGLNPIYIAALVRKNSKKSFGEKAARRLEEDIGIPNEYLDGKNSESAGDVIDQIEKLLRKAEFLSEAERSAYLALLRSHEANRATS